MLICFIEVCGVCVCGGVILGMFFLRFTLVQMKEIDRLRSKLQSGGQGKI